MSGAAMKLLCAMCEAVAFERGVVVDPVYAAPQFGLFMPRDQIARHVTWLRDKGYFDADIDSPLGLAISQEGLDAAKVWKERASDPDAAKAVLLLGSRGVAARETVSTLLRRHGLLPRTPAATDGASATPKLDADLARALAILIVVAPDDPPAPGGAWQPGPRLMLEAGMAIGAARDRSLFVALDATGKAFGEHFGMAPIQLDGTAEAETALLMRLRAIGCELRSDSAPDPLPASPSK